MSLIETGALGRAHLEALLEKLEAGRRGEFCQLYFLDVDVLSTYINFENGNIRSAWSSPLSLVGSGADTDTVDVCPETKQLADAIARTVSGFLMGPFRAGRELQAKRYWLTPEHSLELDELIHAVIEAGHESIGEWHEELATKYLELANADPEDAGVGSRLDTLFDLLRVRAPVGKVARAYQVRSQATERLERVGIYPPADLRRSFVFSAANQSFERNVSAIARVAIEGLMKSVEANQKSKHLVPAIDYLHKLIHSRYGTDRSINRITEVAQADDRLRSLIPGDETTQSLWISKSARIATLEVFDAFAIARLVALADSLEREHPLSLPYHWKVTFVSGAQKPVRMLNQLQLEKIPGADCVEVLHPLSVMRLDEFLRPRHRKSEHGMDMLGDEYALPFLKGAGADAADVEPVKFFESLSRLLSNASGAFAYFDDRSLRLLRSRLESNADSYQRMLRNIGNVISTEFITTFLQLNTLVSKRRNQLPSANLPWLDLPLSTYDQSPADVWMKNIHVGEEQIFPLDELNESDETGYSATVCAALGYLAMGRKSLRSAEHAANTAARNATIGVNQQTDGLYIPEGNEALYLSAFVSRMQVAPELRHRRVAIFWRENHAAVIAKAKLRLSAWAERYPHLADRRPNIGGVSSIQKLIVKYDVEDVARVVFCMLIDCLGSSSVHPGGPPASLGDVEPLWSAKREPLQGLLARLAATLETMESDFQSTPGGFLRTQIAMVFIQTWICFQISEELLHGDSTNNIEIENAIARLLIKPSQSVGTSLMLRALADIFWRYSKAGSSKFGTRSLRINLIPASAEFAGIDKVRLPFLNTLLAGTQKTMSETLIRKEFFFRPLRLSH